MEPLPKVIRDPIYGYVHIAPHERFVLDDPITQRLRNISQTGLAHLVYPEARTSRFAHSIGTMHLASRFLIACIENAEAMVASSLLEELDAHCFDSGMNKVLRHKDMDQLLPADIGHQGGLLSRRADLRRIRIESDRARQILTLVESGLRLAALFHDLGHLPFSHDLEFSLREYAKDSTAPKELAQLVTGASGAPHEVLGHKLADLVLDKLSDDASNGMRGAYQLACKILNADPDRSDELPSLRWLHSLIDGEIDADRADYLLRDARALGFEFAGYDLDRLIDNLVLVQAEEANFTTVVREQGLSALESFLVSRTRSSQFLIRHHKVAQAAAALRYASVEAFKHTEQGKEFVNTMVTLMSDGEGALTKYADFDDGWWLQVLRDFNNHVDKQSLKSSLDFLLYRKNSLQSIWKRKGDMCEDDRLTLNSRMDEFLEKRKDLEERLSQLRDNGILIIHHKFKPYEVRIDDVEKSKVEVLTKSGTIPATDLSPLIKALRSSWQEEIHAHAFNAGEETVNINEILNRLMD